MAVRVIERGLIWFWVVTFQTVRFLFSLTGITCLQLWRPRLPPVCLRTTEASPPTGSTSRCTSWGRSSPQTRPGERSRRCPPTVLLLLMTTMRRVSAASQIFNIWTIWTLIAAILFFSCVLVNYLIYCQWSFCASPGLCMLVHYKPYCFNMTQVSSYDRCRGIKSLWTIYLCDQFIRPSV